MKRLLPLEFPYLRQICTATVLVSIVVSHHGAAWKTKVDSAPRQSEEKFLPALELADYDQLQKREL
jgi:hypothetical protein